MLSNPLMRAPPRSVYLFGPYALNAAKRLLLRNRDIVPLTSKALDTLLALVEKAGRVLTKDELLQRVWPDTVVEESNLTQTVFMLRKALGEKVKEHRYIVTVPKRGYCFVAEVKERPEGTHEGEARVFATWSPPPPRSHGRAAPRQDSPVHKPSRRWISSIGFVAETRRPTCRVAK